MANYTYEEVMTRLRNGVTKVTFLKVDGTKRVMECTLEPSYLPEEFRNRGPVLTEEAGNTIPVWDVQASGWRSFRLDSILSVE